MLRLDNTAITDTAQLPIKKGTLQFLQDAHIATMLANMISRAYPSSLSLTTPYVIWGCENSGSGTNYIIEAGAILYAGEIFNVNATTFTASSGQTAILSIQTTQYTTDADPVTFTDGVARNVHNIRNIAILSGVSGTGIADYSSVVFKRFEPNHIIEQSTSSRLATKSIPIGDWNMDANSSVSVAHGLSNVTKIRSTSVVIINDGSSKVYDLVSADSGSGTEYTGGIIEINATNVELSRENSSLFNSVDFDSTGFNRGFVTLQYEI